MRIIGGATAVCPYEECLRRKGILECYHEKGERSYWNCTHFRNYLFSPNQDKSGQWHPDITLRPVITLLESPVPTLTIPDSQARRLIELGLLHPSQEEYSTMNPLESDLDSDTLRENRGLEE